MKINSLSVLLLILAANMFIFVNESDAAALQNESTLLQGQNFKWHESLFKELCSTPIKWDNACRGQWVGAEKTISSEVSKSRHIPHYQVLSVLKNAISTTYKELRSNTSDININDTNDTWATYKKVYKFLPRIKRNSKLHLHTWHRQLQIYAASFTYLRRAQLYYDFKRYDAESSISQTLRKLELAALHILCEIETTINLITTKKRQPLRPRRMHRILKFQTMEKSFHCNSEADPNEIMQFDAHPPIVNPIDLKFTKFRFLSLLRAMRKIVKQKIISKSNVSHSSIQQNHSSSNTINTSNSYSHSNSDKYFLNSRSIDSSLNSFNRDESSHSNAESIKSLEFLNASNSKIHRNHKGQ